MYRRRLPHCDAPGSPVFVTWRLHDSLPPERFFEVGHLTWRRAFVAWDRLLDRAQAGPVYLRQPEIAGLVRTQLEQVAADGGCTLDAWVIMPNHVHVLWTPRLSLPVLLRKAKGPVARRANALLSRSGPFWQEEYFDRIVRNEREYDRIRDYIEWNPVQAGLVAAPEAFPWSSSSGAKAPPQ